MHGLANVKISSYRIENALCLHCKYQLSSLHIFIGVSTASYSSPNIFRMIKSRRMRWAGHVGRMGERRGVYRVSVRKPEGKRPLGRPRRRWEDNIKMDLQEVGCGGVDWIEVAQERDSWRAPVNVAMNLRVP